MLRCGFSRVFPFQSTLPVGEATKQCCGRSVKKQISIHASRGGSDKKAISKVTMDNISIHASRGGSDKYHRAGCKYLKKFQSTLPVGEATVYGNPTCVGTSRFQSTLPVGEATPQERFGGKPVVISIHASRGGSDKKPFFCNRRRDISIHASRGGSDPADFCNSRLFYDFNPRFPWGKRLLYPPSASVRVKFQSTLPVGEATQKSVMRLFQTGYFNPRFPWGKRPEFPRCLLAIRNRPP